MEVLDFEKLEERKEVFRRDFSSKEPFRYTVIDDFLVADAAERIYDEFPSVDRSTWIDASGLHTKRKWTQPVVAGSIAEQFYREINSERFKVWLSKTTDIKALESDPDLQGAGLHQTLEGGYLDVHVDFNKHSRLNLDRRLNLIVYLCKNYNSGGEGFLELWDMETETLIESVPPKFNRCIVFETNEISYHGHPKPWVNKSGETRKSLSVYYYTEGREDIADTEAHSTLYVNTEGKSGVMKTLGNAARDIARLGPLRRRFNNRR
jgi:hypothetical protein